MTQTVEQLETKPRVETTAQTPEAPPAKIRVVRPRAKKIPRAARIAVTAALVIAALILGIWAFQFYEYSPWTRDGRINAYVVDSAPEVSGQVADVPVQDNQFVHKGDLLYKIDARDYQAAVKRSQAAVDAANAKLALEQENLQRRLKLRPGDVSVQERQSYATAVQADQADVDAAQAALYRAQIDLERCEIRSPVNGWVTNLTVRVGNYAGTGLRQMSVIDADSYWISGYFEETRLQNIHIGDRARAVLMGYPDDKIQGHVESLNRGIADSNTAPNPQGLPQVNPVFTWVRLAQRIPVRIHIDTVPDNVHLAIGETCTVNVQPVKALNGQNGLISGVSPHYPKKLIGQSRHTGNLKVNASGESGVIAVLRAHDNAGMNRNRTVQPHEIPTIDCNETTVVIDGISQHRVVLDPLIRPAHVVRRQHIVPESTKFTHDIDREVLVRVKPRHSYP